MKNKISTQGYFNKRLKDNGYIIWRIFDKYSIGDHRKWTILLNPGYHSVYITCIVNMESVNDTPVFMFDDGGVYIRRDLKIKTDRIEDILTHLIESGITADADDYRKIELEQEFNVSRDDR